MRSRLNILTWLGLGLLLGCNQTLGDSAKADADVQVLEATDDANKKSAAAASKTAKKKLEKAESGEAEYVSLRVSRKALETPDFY